MSSKSQCVICDDPESGDNPIFTCEDCGVGVHMLCYGIKAPSKHCVDPWWCSPCSSGFYGTVCELCLETGGALKKTTCGKYVHVLCGLFSQNVNFVNKCRMEPVNISNISKKHRQQKCVFCHQIRGVCCKCSELNCENFFHVTCAKANNALKEISNPKNNKLVFASYCHMHKTPESSRRISSVFVMTSMMDGDQDEADSGIIEIIGVSSDTSAIGTSYRATDVNGDENDDRYTPKIDSKNKADPSGLPTTHESSSSKSAIDGAKDGNAIETENGDITRDEHANLKSIDIVSGNTHNIGNAADGLGENSTVRDLANSYSNEIGSSDVATSHEPNYAMDNDEEVSNQFWWDYHELQAELRSKDEKIEKVEDLTVSF